MAGAGKIGHIIRSMARFYRTILNNGKNSIRVADELANARSYIDIQLALHENGFAVEYDLGARVNDYYMINIILQPIIENALEHGIGKRRDNDGMLILRAGFKDGGLSLIVEDNGPGMDAETAARVLTSESGGYGIKNVQDRLTFMFGAPYGLTIITAPGAGTRVYVSLPPLTAPVD